MALQFILLFLFIVGIMGMIAFYILKVGYQLQLVRMKKKKPKGEILDIFKNWKNPSDRELRMQALMMYPLLYPVEIEENEKTESVAIKKIIKRLNITLYAILIVLLLVVVYAGKKYPEGLF